MKKIFLYAGLVLGAAFMASCDDDYTDWADPQAYDQEEDAEAVCDGVISAVASQVAYEEAEDGTLALFSLISVEGAADDATLSITEVTINGSTDLTYSEEDGVVSVDADELDALMQETYESMAYTTRELTISAKGVALDEDGVGLSFSTNEISLDYLTAPLPDCASEEAYYYIGGYNGWDLASPVAMTDNGDGTFSVTLEVGDSEWFKFVPQSAVGGDWTGLLGCSSDGSTATSDFLVVDGGSMLVETGGTYEFTIDLVNFRYTITAIASLLYLPGNGNGWDTATCPALAAQDDGSFTGFAYLDGDFKFTLERNWNSEYNYTNFTSYPDGWGQGDGTNINVPTAGYYWLTVVPEGAITAYLIEKVGVIGDYNSWGGGTDLTYNADDESWSGTVTLDGGGWKFWFNDSWDNVDLGGDSYESLAKWGSNLPSEAGTFLITLHASRIDSDNIYCTVEAQ